jgi:hypothetical protein
MKDLVATWIAALAVAWTARSATCAFAAIARTLWAASFKSWFTGTTASALETAAPAAFAATFKPWTSRTTAPARSARAAFAATFKSRPAEPRPAKALSAEPISAVAGHDAVQCGHGFARILKNHFFLAQFDHSAKTLELWWTVWPPTLAALARTAAFSAPALRLAPFAAFAQLARFGALLGVGLANLGRFRRADLAIAIRVELVEQLLAALVSFRRIGACYADSPTKIKSRRQRACSNMHPKQSCHRDLLQWKMMCQPNRCLSTDSKTTTDSSHILSPHVTRISTNCQIGYNNRDSVPESCAPRDQLCAALSHAP